MKAKLVFYSAYARVIVSDDATHDEIMEAAAIKISEQVTDQFREGVQDVFDDTENPYNLITDGELFYKGKNYPVRTISIDDESVRRDINISVDSLLIALGPLEDWTAVEDQVDAQVYFYIEDKNWHLSDQEIAENYLDEEFILYTWNRLNNDKLITQS